MKSRRLDFIRPCPFCGNKKVDVVNGMLGITMIHCKKCSCNVSFIGSKNEQDALLKWSVRSEDKKE